MQFFKPEKFKQALCAIYKDVKARVFEVLPDCEIEHIGSSAIVGAISKGDLDILVKVDHAQLEASVQKVQSLGFEIKQGTLRTDSLCMLVTNEFAEDVAIQVIARGSKFENFVKFRDRLNGDPGLVEQYNNLKNESVGLSEEDYRKKKSVFIEGVLSDKSDKK